MNSRRGVLLLVIGLTLLGMLTLFAALRLRAPGHASSSSLLVFDLPEEIEEGDAPRALGLGYRARSPYFVHEIVEGLRHAAGDEHVAGLVLHVDDLDWGWGKATEIRDAIQAFRDAGKPVYASIISGGEMEYMIASVADLVAMPPSGTLGLDGLSESALFLKGSLDKLGVTPNYAQAGVYKSAVEQYTRSGMSPPAREALDALLDAQYSILVDTLAAARGFNSDDVRRLVDEGPYTADEARSLGLVDTVLYDAEVDSLAINDQDADVSTTSFAHYLERLHSPRFGPHIALITASGTIMPGKSVNPPGEDQVMGSETMIDALDEARTRDAIKAVVLRIDSPGGSVQASDDIWREVKRLADEKPVIVSMSDLAASGGYYIATPAQEIVAQPSTLTGSIGVFGGKFNIMGLLKKLGVNVETVSRGDHAQMMSPYRDFTPTEKRLYQQQIEDAYRLFLSHVEDGRGFTYDEADSIAQGRVWSGLDAYQIGLVDTLGGLETAIRLACDAGGIKHRDPLVIETLPHVQHHWYETLLDDLLDNQDQDSDFGQARALLSLVPGEKALWSPVLRAWWTASRLQSRGVYALMPYDVRIR